MEAPALESDRGARRRGDRAASFRVTAEGFVRMGRGASELWVEALREPTSAAACVTQNVARGEARYSVGRHVAESLTSYRARAPSTRC